MTEPNTTPNGNAPPEVAQARPYDESIEKVESDRNATIKDIKHNLQRRSGKAWSVTGGRGTAWGWIHIKAPPSRCRAMHRPRPGVDEHDYRLSHRERYEDYDCGQPGRSMFDSDCEELGKLLGLDRPAYDSGESVPASGDYRREYIARARGQIPAKLGEPYWD